MAPAPTATPTPAQTSAAATTLAPQQRTCTRCDGQQHRVAEADRMGLYSCDTCQMRVVYDLDATEPETLKHRGQPWKYTADHWGPRLAPAERRL